MKILAIAASVMAVALGAAIPSIASAQATRTWVSGVGDDANPCSRTAPCKTFAGAISKTAAGGEINVLDPGGFGAVTITKSITIGTDPALGGTLNSLTNGVIINAAATDVVTLRGLVITAPTIGGSTGLNGVRILAAGTVNIENGYIYGNRSASPNGNGIVVANTASTLRLNVINTLISENGVGTTGGAILIKPTGTGSATVTLDGVTLIDNTRGLVVEAAGTTGAVLMTVSDSSITNNTRSGIAVTTGATAVNVAVNGTTLSNNLTGLYVEGSGGAARISDNVFTSNVNGLQNVSGGQIISYGNNVIDSNATNGAPTSTVLLK